MNTLTSKPSLQHSHSNTFTLEHTFEHSLEHTFEPTLEHSLGHIHFNRDHVAKALKHRDTLKSVEREGESHSYYIETSVDEKTNHGDEEKTRFYPTLFFTSTQ